MRVIKRSAAESLVFSPAIPSLLNSEAKSLPHPLLPHHHNPEPRESGAGMIATQRISRIKAENSNVVESAVQEPCNVLSLSSSINTIHINFESQSQIKNRQKYNLMWSLAMLRVLKKVHAKGVPKYLAEILPVLWRKHDSKDRWCLYISVIDCGSTNPQGCKNQWRVLQAFDCGSTDP